ncbi:MAG: flagellar biosynthesis regulator FlaF [Thiobacillaceae bacterium]
MHAKPLDAYQAIEKTTQSGRELEASVLMRAAQLLADVQHHWHAPERNERLDHALRHNMRIWTLFQAELTRADNPLPPELRSNLLTLSTFIDKRSFEVMADPDPAKLDILISINKNIAAGLRGNLGGEV